MNRSERRRQEALQGGQAGLAIRGLLDEGKALQQAGRLREAEGLYRHALSLAPNQHEALHLLGLALYRQNRIAEAIDCLTAALEQQPSLSLYWFNLGVISQKIPDRQEAIKAYRQAIALNPRYLEAHLNLGNALRDRGALQEAIAAYRQALALNPSHAETHNNLGVALKEEGKLDQAITAYRRALELKPSHVEALNNLGLALMENGTLHEAIASFRQALSLMPGYQTARYNLGIALSWVGDDEQAVECLQELARAKHDHGKPIAETSVFRSRLRHDIEQLHYLFDQRRLHDGHRPYLDALEKLEAVIGKENNPGNRTAVPPEMLASVAPSFNRILCCEPPARLNGGALSASLDVEAVESRYLSRQPEVTYIDRLLSDEALQALRRFCWEATIWKKDYENGYSGAFLGDGFASPLLFQIAEELRRKFPRIFKQHRLTQAWAFKHDSSRRGLNIHADAAAVNVNFWITSDEANLNPESGGLVVYDKEAPREWNFKDYNSDGNKPKILAWLKDVGAQALNIPYRANRAVVFNSDLFHETDEISFRDDYTSRRINITLLYGYRHAQ